MEKFKVDIYQELVDLVGGENILIPLVLTSYMTKNKVIRLKAHAVSQENEGEKNVVIRILETTSKSVIVDEQEKGNDIT